MGATATLGARRRRRASGSSRCARLTGGRGVDVVIEASGAPEAMPQALDMVRDGGRMIVCGHYTDNGAVEIHPHWQINRKHVELQGLLGLALRSFPSRGRAHGALRRREAVARNGQRPLHAGAGE